MSDFSDLLERAKKYSLKFELLGVPESLNKTLRMHWGKRHAQTKYWHDMVYFETRGKRPVKPLEKARISIVRHSPRSLDFDGVVGSCKIVIDGLVRAGIIRDDNWSCVGAWCVDQVKSKEQKLVVEVNET